MTTEIAIMNKSGVALAADSAGTVATNSPEGKVYKIRNTSDKLFSLSKYAPVGIMINGNAEMLGIPWETIIKMYREKLDKKEFPLLKDYCSDFFKFLDNFNVSQELQDTYLTSITIEIIKKIKSDHEIWIKKELDEKSLSEIQIKNKLENIIKKCHGYFLEISKKSQFSKSKRVSLEKKYSPLIEAELNNAFEYVPLSKQMKTCLISIAINASSVGFQTQFFSGVIIAGFGKDDLYPSCYNFGVVAVFEEKTIIKDTVASKITDNNSALVLPFAQSKDIETFMEGINPSLKKFTKDIFYDVMIKEFPDALSCEVSDKLKLTQKQKKDLAEITKNMCKGVCDFIFEKITQRQQQDYINPVITATNFLTKSELANMAETLVNLVSFRKQVTMEVETVGGPIDVLVITKGDGPVWIKRKHYFAPDLNHHFFNNYFKGSTLV